MLNLGFKAHKRMEVYVTTGFEDKADISNHPLLVVVEPTQSHKKHQHMKEYKGVGVAQLKQVPTEVGSSKSAKPLDSGRICKAQLQKTINYTTTQLSCDFSFQRISF